MSFKASAPGSLMLLGEYAVLHGKKALVCAVDKRMTVKLTPRNDKTILISSALGQLTFHLSELQALELQKPFQFVLAVLKKYRRQIKMGCDIEIVSEFSDKIGFASSAAVTVAMLCAIVDWLSLPFHLSRERERPTCAFCTAGEGFAGRDSSIEITNHKPSPVALCAPTSPVNGRGETICRGELIRTARAIIRSVQGTGSGADVAACVLGGAVAYQAKPFSAEKIAFDRPITVIYSGSKTPTVEAITYVQTFFDNKKKLFRQLIQSIGECAEIGIQAAKEKNWRQLADAMNIQQGLMDALGVNTPILQQLIMQLRAQPNMLGAKISGSGLGDCVIGLGNCHLLSRHPERSEGSPSDRLGQREILRCAQDDGDNFIQVNITNHGVCCE